ncbi:MAG: hypothetical protein HY431_02635 [Candidatus Levybacteria bacterium]|nr:hypothetical protein [Candidatus Levybacteria bacterium]
MKYPISNIQFPLGLSSGRRQISNPVQRIGHCLADRDPAPQEILDIRHWTFNKGFTVIEMVVYIGTLAIFLAILTQVFTSILNIRTKTESTSSLEQDSKYILSRLVYDINRAQAITTPGSLGDQGSRLDITIDGNPYSYFISGNNLMMTDTTGTYALNSNGTTVSGLNFLRLGPELTGRNTVQVNLTITSAALSTTGVDKHVIQTTVGTR